LRFFAFVEGERERENETAEEGGRDREGEAVEGMRRGIIIIHTRFPFFFSGGKKKEERKRKNNVQSLGDYNYSEIIAYVSAQRCGDAR